MNVGKEKHYICLRECVSKHSNRGVLNFLMNEIHFSATEFYLVFGEQRILLIFTQKQRMQKNQEVLSVNCFILGEHNRLDNRFSGFLFNNHFKFFLVFFFIFKVGTILENIANNVNL